MSMSDAEVMDFAKASAEMAFDQRRDRMYTPDFTAFDSYQDNVIDTMNEHRVQGPIYHLALAEYAKTYERLAK